MIRKYLYLICCSLCLNSFAQTNVKDIDGNVYKTIAIGNQEWFAENLRTTHLNNGTEIPLLPSTDICDDYTILGYSWYNNNISFKKLHGALYTWQVIKLDIVCPIGWHVPDDSEWNQLCEYISQSYGPFKKDNINNSWNSVGYYLKSETGWDEEFNGIDKVGFNAQPSGTRACSDGSFFQIGRHSDFWSSTEFDKEQGSVWFVNLKQNTFFHNSEFKNTGISIRCLKD